MSNFQPPVSDPAIRDFLLGQTDALMRTFVRDELDDCMPCRVTEVNGSLVSVQPLPLLIMADRSTRRRPIIPDIPVAWPGSQGSVLRFDIQPGALGWIKASDRDISLILETLGEARPNTLRRHSFSDAFFLPADFSAMTPAGDGAAVLQTRDGSAFVSVGAGEINATVGAASAVLTPSGFTVTVGGVALEFTGASLKMNGIEIGPLHTHGGVTPGSGTSGVVTP